MSRDPSTRLPASAARRRVLAAGLTMGLTFGLALAGGLAATVAFAADAVTVFAAASMKGSLDKVAEAFKAQSGKSVTISYAASSALAKQIEAAAPADIFISADEDWMNYLADKKLIKPETRSDLLGNALVLVEPTSSNASVELKPGVDLVAAAGDGRIATGDVKSVPVGKYAKAALEALGIWDKVEPRLAQAENVRAALALVARGEAAFGIVYATDAKAEKNVKVAAVFPENTHPPVVYPIALTAASTSADAAAFLAYVKGPEAGAVFSAAGFTVLK